MERGIRNRAVRAAGNTSSEQFTIKVFEDFLRKVWADKIEFGGQGNWKDETSKSRFSAFVINDNKITEIHFGGKTRFVTIAE